MDVVQVDFTDEVVPMEGCLTNHNEKLTEFDPLHQSSEKNHGVSSSVFEWEVEITDQVLQATNPLVSLIYFQLFMLHFIIYLGYWIMLADCVCFFLPKLDYLFIQFHNLLGHIVFEFTRHKQMSIILMDLDTMELYKMEFYKADIIQCKDRDEKCI
jgi:hypothetical protein